MADAGITFLGISAFIYDLSTYKVSLTHHHQLYMDMQGVFLSTTSRMDMQGVSRSQPPAVWMRNVSVHHQ
jgi:hypothetical protein